MLNRTKLGRTGIEVTELCFGALPFGPLQKRLPVDECAAIVARALRGGVNFVDTAQLYGTYEPIRLAMEETGIRPVIASKCTAPDYDTLARAVDEALEKLGVDRIDIFHLHAARASADVFQVRAGAHQALLDAKRDGKIRAVGISAHSVKTVEAAAGRDDIDVVFPLVNMTGTGILEGDRESMLAAIAKVAAAGQGLYLMKALAGGTLVGRFAEAMGFARGVSGSAAVALGMVSVDEVDYNLRYFDDAYTGDLAAPAVDGERKRFTVTEFLCSNCGACEAACPSGAIQATGTKRRIDAATCLSCGYCVPACPMFAIRVV